MTSRGFGTEAAGEADANLKPFMRVAPLHVAIDALERGIARRSRRVVAPRVGRAAAAAADGGAAVRRPRRPAQPRRGARDRAPRARAAHDAAGMSARRGSRRARASDVGIVSWTIAQIAGRVTGGKPARPNVEAARRSGGAAATIAPSSLPLVRRGSQTNEPPEAAPASSSWQTTFGSTCARMAPSSGSESGTGTRPPPPGCELDRRACVAPDHDLAQAHREDTGQRRGRQRGYLVGVTQPPEVDEQPREGREVERSALAQLLRERRERLGERLDELRRVLGQRPFGLDVERTHDEGARPQRDRELGAPRWAARRGSRDRPARPASADRVRDGSRAP